ncbi:MAG: hypothetical protein GY777_28005 [Candidatus Brocadiaceae bacterium]|nr:hypothetical protein [Candidatus Brocadiaceae bacterium]
MEIIDLNQTNHWLNERGLIDTNGKFTLLGFKEYNHYRIPIDSGKKTALAKVIGRIFEDEGESLLWIDEFGIWPSSENWNLFFNFRKSIGETCPLHEKPGHLFSKTDIDEAVSLLSLVLYFYWGVVLIPKSLKFLLRISHDEVISVLTDGNADNKESIKPVIIKLNSILRKKGR